MPVPSSYNDITQDKALRDFVGWAWYDKEFYFPKELMNKRIILRVDSAHYNSIVVSGTPSVCISAIVFLTQKWLDSLVIMNKNY